MSKLRVGLLIDGNRQPAWVCQLVRVIQDSEFASIVQVVQFDMDPDQQRELKLPIVRKFLLSVQKLLIGNARAIHNALAEEDTSELFAAIPKLLVRRTSSACNDSNCSSEVDGIRALDLDVLIQICSSKPCDEIFRIARYGVWSYDFTRDSRGNYEPAGYRDVLHSNPETESVLRIRKFASDTGIVAYRSFSSTHVGSIVDNASNSLWKALYFVPRKLEELHSTGEREVLAAMQNDVSLQNDSASKEFEELTNLKLASILGGKLMQKVSRKWRSVLYYKQWFLMYKRGPIEAGPLRDFTRLTPPKDRLWADPFVIFRDDKYSVFIEEYILGKEKGIISVMVLNQDGTVDSPVAVLEKDYHLSYPFIFEYENEFYMIPESSQNLAVDLYKCRNFPYEWEFCSNLISGFKVVDPTLLFWEDHWWMFGNSVSNDKASTWDELHIYFSKSLFSNDWRPHPKNPVISDVRCARPAGKIFLEGGRLYRPSQNCARHYGYGINVAMITKLSDTEYEEQIVSRLKPEHGDGVLSMHTLNQDHGLTIIDAQQWRRR